MLIKDDKVDKLCENFMICIIKTVLLMKTILNSYNLCIANGKDFRIRGILEKS